MKIKASPGLNLIVMAVTMAVATAPVFFVNGWYKWVISVAALVVGGLVEYRIERAYAAADIQ